MANPQGKGLIAVVGLLAALFGGGITAGLNYVFETESREAAELSSRRTAAYLNFVTTKDKRDAASATLRRVVNDIATATNTDSSEVQYLSNVCDKLVWQLEESFPNWPANVKLRVKKKCEEYRTLRNELFILRDTLAIYGSDQVLESLAKNERALYLRNSLESSTEKQLAQMKARDTYAKLILQMRQDRIDQNGSSITFNDLVAVICGLSLPCLGSEDASHLKGSQ